MMLQHNLINHCIINFKNNLSIYIYIYIFQYVMELLPFRMSLLHTKCSYHLPKLMTTEDKRTHSVASQSL